MKLSQILCVTIEELKRKVDLGEAVIDEVEDKPQKIGIESKLSFPNPFDDLSFFLVVRGHVRGIGRGGKRVQRPVGWSDLAWLLFLLFLFFMLWPLKEAPFVPVHLSLSSTPGGVISRRANPAPAEIVPDFSRIFQIPSG